MGARRREPSSRLTAQSAELLEVRTLLSAIADRPSCDEHSNTGVSFFNCVAAGSCAQCQGLHRAGQRRPESVRRCLRAAGNRSGRQTARGGRPGFELQQLDGRRKFARHGDDDPKGLTTALGVLRNGFVLVGNVPTSDGTLSTIQKGSLLILDKQGDVVANLQDPVKLDGPWALTVADYGNLAFV
jgi:hypothetical protein